MTDDVRVQQKISSWLGHTERWVIGRRQLRASTVRMYLGSGWRKRRLR